MQFNDRGSLTLTISSIDLFADVVSASTNLSDCSSSVAASVAAIALITGLPISVNVCPTVSSSSPSSTGDMPRHTPEKSVEARRGQYRRPVCAGCPARAHGRDYVIHRPREGWAVPVTDPDRVGNPAFEPCLAVECHATDACIVLTYRLHAAT